jgi:adenosylcobinamide-GDP ribazoletransferase
MIGARISEARLALMLLTRLPVGRIAMAMPMGAAFWAYPLAGAVVGLIGGLAAAAVLVVGLPAEAAALAALGATALATGALHEDGLADSADALGGHDAPTRLAIMKDSRIGSYGVIALILTLGLRAVLIVALAEAGAAALIAGLVVAGAASRAGLPAMLRHLPPARASGLGQLAAQGGSAAGAGIAAGLGAAALMALPGGPLAAPLVALICLGAGRLARRRLGGVTGDVLGATQVLAEIAILATLAAFAPTVA